MRRTWMILALLAVFATTADAAERWRRTSPGHRYTGSTNWSGRSAIYLPQQNQLWVGQNVGDVTVYQQTPLWQFGASNYQFNNNGTIDPYRIQQAPYGWPRPIWVR